LPRRRRFPIRPSSTREEFNVPKDANIEAVGAFVEQFRAPQQMIRANFP
jgi:hypothetical protein